MSERPLLPAPKGHKPKDPLTTSIRGPVFLGVAIIAVAFGGLGTWSALASLSSAAIAPGVVAVEGSRKTIQHLEGGIIEDILIEEGAYVEADQVLIRLAETRPNALYAMLLGQYRAARALEARLVAEREGLASIAFPDELVDAAGDPEVIEILQGQTQLFETRRTSREGQIAILQQRTAQYEEQIAGIAAQRRSSQEQIALINDELEGVRELYEKGLAKKTRLLELERAAAELNGEIGQLSAEISRTKQSIGEAELRIIDLDNEFRTEVSNELREVQERLAELEEQLGAQKDVVERLEIRAPQAGIIQGLKFHTPGGVITPGAAILDIVPTEDRLLIEAHVRPEDIDSVHAGLWAEVRLTAYKQRSTPQLDGEVTSISADRFVDERTGIAYYLARVEVDADELARLDDVELYPGMPADVYILTGERKAFEYFLAPITNSMHRAFREP